MKKAILYLMLLLTPAPLLAQEDSSDSVTGNGTDVFGDDFVIGPILNITRINYTYDAAGNRIRRINRFLPLFGNGNENPESRCDVGGKAVSLSGASGCYQLVLSTWSSADRGALAIYNTSGQLITSATITSTETAIDLVSCPDGVYIAYIKINTDTQGFEFAKK